MVEVARGVPLGRLGHRDVVDGVGVSELTTQLRQLDSVARTDIFQAAKETVPMRGDANVPSLSRPCCSYDSPCSPVERKFVGALENRYIKPQPWNRENREWRAYPGLPKLACKP